MTGTPTLDIDIVAVDGRKVWPLFAPHHYLTGKYTGHGAFMAVLPDGTPVAFTSFIAFPHGKIKNAKREHRTVVLPDFQGLGIGARLSDWLAEYLVNELGHRYYSRTSHPRLGAYRDAHAGWRSTTKGPTTITQEQVDALTAAGKSSISANVRSVGRYCWSHEYVGRAPRIVDTADAMMTDDDLPGMWTRSDFEGEFRGGELERVGTFAADHAADMRDPEYATAYADAVRETTSPASFAPADTAPAPLAPVDPVAAYIARTDDVDALRAAWRASHPAPWRPEHVAVVKEKIARA